MFSHLLIRVSNYSLGFSACVIDVILPKNSDWILQAAQDDGMQKEIRDYCPVLVSGSDCYRKGNPTVMNRDGCSLEEPIADKLTEGVTIVLLLCK
jgi:hypothetical protein